MKASCGCRDPLLYSMRRQNTAKERSHCLRAPLLFLSKKIVVPAWGHNGGANVRDSRGLNLQGKCFVTERNASHPSEIMFVFILLWSLVSEMDHGVVVCSLEEVCSSLVNMLPCSRDSCHPDISSLDASPRRVCFESKLLFPRSGV